ncbi:MAG TPA: hypothetical protein VGO53_07750, partial [Steroidobacteraceae bacterium]|nr:hypothetical protein [Steroidobacteraceae bacterium]
QPAFALFDLSVGGRKDNYTFELFAHNLFDKRNQTYRSTECGISGPAGAPLCGQEPYIYGDAPRTIGVRFGQKF